MSEHADSHGQPAPTGHGTMIAPLVAQDVLARMIQGDEKYHTPLRANNGRRALVDAYQEALDLANYIKQEIVEQDTNGQKAAEVGVFSVNQIMLMQYILAIYLTRFIPTDGKVRSPADTAMGRRDTVAPDHFQRVESLFDSITVFLDKEGA